MKPKEWFIPHLMVMKAGYDHAETEAIGEWRHHRVDDVMILEDDKQLTLVFIGTQAKIRDWLYNFMFSREEWSNMGRVHRGFARDIHEIMGRQDEPQSLLNRCIRAYRLNKKITFLGHSRGYPLAVLAASFVVSHGVGSRLMKVIGCAGARVGNKQFKKAYAEMLGHRTFVLNGSFDPVTFVPPWGAMNGKVTKIDLGYLPKHRINHYIEKAEQNEIQPQAIQL